jgi:hypothetical protein
VTVDPQLPADASRRLLLVVGVGRSGTSLLVGILRQLGFHVPQPEIHADQSNPRGFGEPRWVVDFHTRLLRKERVTVFDARPAAWEKALRAAGDEDVFGELRSWLAVQFVGVQNVVIKDPRVGWFLPMWLRAASDLDAQTSFVTMLRDPLEIVSSARTWYGTWQADASRAAAWLNITLHTELATRAAPRAFVRYERLLDDWRNEISRAAEPLELPELSDIEASRAEAVDAFVDPGLRRSPQGGEDLSLPPALQAMIEDVWRRVSALADSPGGDAVLSPLDDARAAYTQFYEDAEAIAQSSVTAVKPRLERRKTQSARATPGGGPPRPYAPLPLRLVRRIPARYRRRAPLRWRRAALRAGRRLVHELRPRG